MGLSKGGLRIIQPGEEYIINHFETPCEYSGYKVEEKWFLEIETEHPGNQYRGATFVAFSNIRAFVNEVKNFADSKDYNGFQKEKGLDSAFRTYSYESKGAEQYEGFSKEDSIGNCLVCGDSAEASDGFLLFGDIKRIQNTNVNIPVSLVHKDCCYSFIDEVKSSYVGFPNVPEFIKNNI